MSARGEFFSLQRMGFPCWLRQVCCRFKVIFGAFPTKSGRKRACCLSFLMYFGNGILLAYPVLMAELIIGRAKRANMIDAHWLPL